MIIVNGTVSAKIASGGGLDGNGNPVAPQDTWGAPIPCNIAVNRQSSVGRQNGNTFTVASYEVLISLQPFDAGTVKIAQLGRDLGAFSVISTEHLSAVGATKITV